MTQAYIENTDEGITIFDERGVFLIRWLAEEIRNNPLESARDIQAFTEVFCSEGIEGVRQLVESLRPKNPFQIPFDFRKHPFDGVMFTTVVRFRDQFLTLVMSQATRPYRVGIRLNLLSGCFTLAEVEGAEEQSSEWLADRLDSGYYEQAKGHIFTHIGPFPALVPTPKQIILSLATRYLITYWNKQNDENKLEEVINNV